MRHAVRLLPVHHAHPEGPERQLRAFTNFHAAILRTRSPGPPPGIHIGPFPSSSRRGSRERRSWLSRTPKRGALHDAAARSHQLRLPRTNIGGFPRRYGAPKARATVLLREGHGRVDLRAHGATRAPHPGLPEEVHHIK